VIENASIVYVLRWSWTSAVALHVDKYVCGKRVAEDADGMGNVQYFPEPRRWQNLGSWTIWNSCQTYRSQWTKHQQPSVLRSSMTGMQK